MPSFSNVAAVVLVGLECRSEAAVLTSRWLSELVDVSHAFLASCTGVLAVINRNVLVVINKKYNIFLPFLIKLHMAISTVNFEHHDNPTLIHTN